MFTLCYNREVLELISKELPKSIRDEMAIPSYQHRNPIIRWLVAWRMRIVIHTMELTEHQALLDFGCGIGMLFLQLPPHKHDYYGVDQLIWPAKQMLELHGREDVRLLETTDWSNHVPDGSLDHIIALEVLEHVDDVRRLARKFLEKLKPSGQLIICGPTENRTYRLGRKIAGFSGKYHHGNIYHIMKDLESIGFIGGIMAQIPLPSPLALFVVCRYQPG